MSRATYRPAFADDGEAAEVSVQSLRPERALTSLRDTCTPYPRRVLLTPHLKTPMTTFATVLKVGVVGEAAGSSYIEMHNTKLICSVFGPRQSTQTAEYSVNGRLWCDFKFAPFAEHSQRSDLRRTDRERQLSQALQSALLPSVRLETFPKASAELFVIVLQDDGGAFEAAITAASLALADAGVDLFDLMAACSACVLGTSLVLDPTSKELESDVRTSKCCVSYMPTLQQVTLAEQSGETESGRMRELFDSCIDGCAILVSLMRKTLLQSAA